MGPLFFLSGMLLIMMSVIWIVGEILRKDLILGIVALATFPIFSAYWTFFRDYKRCKTPFFAFVSGLTCLLIGKVIGW